MDVCVIGLGYIGLPLSSVLARCGHRVRGVDIDREVLQNIRSGQLPGLEPSLGEAIGTALASGSLDAAEAPSRADVYIVAVPTPLDGGRRAELSHVEKAIDSIAPFLQAGSLVVIESTVPVGTTERMAARLAGKRTDLAPGNESPSFFMAHCPERVLPGKIFEELVGLDRVVGGIDPESTARAADFYSSFVKGQIHRTDVRTAEMCKLVENASRDVSIAFANEVSMLCALGGVDSSNLIRLANRHPRVNIMEPGPGVGGHCIPVDPWFLVQSAPEETRLIRSAREVNERKTEWVLERIAEAARRFENPVVACLGLAYKANVNDLRESPALSIAVSLCSERDFSVRVVEPHVRELPPSLGRFRNCRLTGLEQALSEAHVVALLTRHREFEGLPEGLRAGTVFIDPNGSVQEVGPETERGKRP
jgi:UDP-N-acetyl-D-mannosaminuronic acid dehydrogenase